MDIFFNTASFDKIVRDANTNYVLQLSLVGGTLGLFTGFSAMSAVEIMYYLTKMVVNIVLYFHSLRKKKKESKITELQPNGGHGEHFKSLFTVDNDVLNAVIEVNDHIGRYFFLLNLLQL